MIASRSMFRPLILLSGLAFASACAQKPWIHAARSGSLSELQRYVEVASARKQLDRSQAIDLAQTVAEREIETADDNAVFERFASLAACASEVYWPLKHRSKGRDEGAAAAALALFEAGLTEGIPSVPSNVQSDAWRAYSIRLSLSREQRPAVYSALRDGERRVRYSALRVLQADPVPADAKELLDVARLDPDLALKQMALSALGELGDVNALTAARELWDGMVESTRLALVQAFNAFPMRTQGGVSLLARVMESSDSMEGVVAASLLFHDGTAARGYAFARLLRALHEGSTSEKLVALSALPSNDLEVQKQLEQFAKSNTPFLRTAALDVQLKNPGHASAARSRLQEIAASKEADAYEAARILALQGDAAALMRVEQQVSAPSAQERLGAARLLLKKQRWAAVARALTDDHPSVRLSLACDVLAQ